MDFRGIQATSQTNLNPPNYSENLESISQLMEDASKNHNLTEARISYNQAYKLIIKSVSKTGEKLTPAMRGHFFKLISEYASRICYNQGEGAEKENGFRKSARLNEFLVAELFLAMNLDAPKFDWEAQTDLEALSFALQLTEQTAYTGYFFDFISHLTDDKTALAQKASDNHLRKELAQAFKQLAFSLQNIAVTRQSSQANYQLHKRLNDITEALINDGSDEQKQQALEYAYNRCGFMVDLQMPNDQDDKMSPEKSELILKTYELIGQRIKDVLKDHPAGVSMQAQVKNMIGILTIDQTNSKTLAVALPFFKEALALRQPLFDVYKNNLGKLIDQRGLYANAINGVIHCLLKGDRVTSANLEEAKGLASFLKNHIKDLEERGDVNTYKDRWKAAIAKVDAAVVNA